MIDYMRTRYIGTHYLLIIKGSVIPRVAPTALLGGLIAGLIAGFRVSYYDPKTNDHYDPIGEVFGHTYGMQLFGIVFGYLMVGRLNICYARYWEGVSHIKTMHSKWADAAAQVLAFDRIDDLSCDISDEDFCEHIVRARYTIFLFFSSSLIHISTRAHRCVSSRSSARWPRSICIWTSRRPIHQTCATSRPPLREKPSRRCPHPTSSPLPSRRSHGAVWRGSPAGRPVALL